MQKPLILNPILTRIYDKGQTIYLKTKIRHIKPIVDSKCPESFFYMQNKLGNTHKNNWNGKQINMDTNNLFKKIKFTQKIKRNVTKSSKYRPLFKYDHEFFSYYRKENLINVALENLQIYNRLSSKKGTYTLKNHLRDYDKAQYYKKNYCKFPSIDFYRTSRAGDSNLCPIFNYCTFYNYKKINEKLSSEYMKKSNSHIMHKAKSAYELFNVNKKKKKKIFLFPHEKRIEDEEQKCYNNIRNDIYKNSGKFQTDKKKEEKEKDINENENIDNNKEENVDEDNYKSNKSNNDENINKNIENNLSNKSLKNNENEINSNEIKDNIDNNNDIITNNIKNKESIEREEISEKISGDENKEEKIDSQKKIEFINNMRENSRKKEESEIEESIDNEKDKNKNKKGINEERKEEKEKESDNKKEEEIKQEENKIDNKEDDDDKLVDILNDNL